MKTTLLHFKNKQHFIITTTSGTRWGAVGTSLADVRKSFFGNKIGLEIESITLGRLFSHEEEEELRRDKLEHSCRD